MAQSGWRLPDDLLKRVRVRCAEEGVRQNAWVERALEKALGDFQGTGRSETAMDSRDSVSRSASSRASDDNPFSAVKRAEREVVARGEEPSPAAKPRARKASPKAPAGGLPSIAPRHWAP